MTGGQIEHNRIEEDKTDYARVTGGQVACNRIEED